jgi:hypothetical protein
MALNKGEVNPLNVLKFRKLNFIPKHFKRISINSKVNVKEIEYWIEYNLNSRYAIISTYNLDENRKVITSTEIGLEDPKEITLLSLGCNILHKQKKEN